MPTRALYAVLAWAAATATAMAVVWAGLDSMLSSATAGPHVAVIAAWPVQDAAATPGAGAGAGEGAGTSGGGATSPSPVPSQATNSDRGGAGDGSGSGGNGSAAAPTPTPTPAVTLPTPPASSTPSADDGVQRRYTNAGGTVVLTIDPTMATLDAATPAAGYTVQYWLGDGFVEVEFSPNDAGTAYEVIATWAGTSPQVQNLTIGG